ncbi:hypothetical protein CLV40_12194 [Actinokineospora auranticolor]|uniref:DUF3558 domain-containing protein n=1 Tax=Actinokineospora auranticolor TaxID=155976 RepID=A0A2S6GGA1_9PSEU|nr:hypothetical protein CLV40_12194 [Actinokineospora auranticolor]
MAVLAGILLVSCGVDRGKWANPQRTHLAPDAGFGGTSGPPTTSGAKPTTTTSRTSAGAAFTLDALREVDPCGLMAEKTLKGLGEPAENRLRDYAQCSNYMKDTRGKDLNFTLTIGETATVKPDGKTVGGLPLAQTELDDHTACFLTAITDTNANQGITVQTGTRDASDSCTPGRALLEAAVNRIREGAPELKVDNRTLRALEPCTLFSNAVLETVVGTGPRTRPNGLHGCGWNGDDVSFSLRFRIAMKPDDLAETSKTTPVNLGDGVTAQQLNEVKTGARCRLEWAHAAFPGDNERAEVVSLEFSRYSAKAGEDVCAKTQTVAKSLIPRLPKR